MGGALYGWWADGQTAARHRVEMIGVSGGALQLRSVDNGQVLAELSLRGLRLSEHVFPGQPVRVTHRDWPDALLTLDTPDLLGRLGPEAAHLQRRYRFGRNVGRGIVIWGGATVVSLVGLVLAVPVLAGLVAPALPAAWTSELGDKVVERIERDRPACEGPQAEAALQGLLDRLLAARNSDTQGTLRVLDASSVNAVAVPGGHMRVFSGLVAEVDKPQALAAVVAHELAHVIKRHPSEAAIRQVGWRIVLAAAIGDASTIPQIAGRLSTGLLEQAYSREAEAEADRMAVAMLNEAGIDSRGMIDLFESLQQQREVSVPEWLSSHPALANRIEAVRPRVKPGEPGMTDADWQAVQAMCD